MTSDANLGRKLDVPADEKALLGRRVSYTNPAGYWRYGTITHIQWRIDFDTQYKVQMDDEPEGYWMFRREFNLVPTDQDLVELRQGLIKLASG